MRRRIEMKKIILIIIVIFLSAVTSHGSNVQFDFEDDSVGSFPADWNHFTPTTSEIEVVDESVAPGAIFDGEKSLRINFLGGSGTGGYTLFDPVYKGVAEFYMRVDHQTDNIGAGIATGAPGTGVIGFGIRYLPEIPTYICSGWLDTGVPVIYGEYVKFTMYFDSYLNTVTLFINDNPTDVVNAPFSEPINGQGLISFSSSIETDVGGSALWYLDNISITSVPDEPTFPDDTQHPTGAVHAHDNMIWPPNNKTVTVTLDGYVKDELSIARDGEGIGVSSAYILIDGSEQITLRDETTNLLDNDGQFSIGIEVKATKGAEYLIELYAGDTEPEDDGGPNTGLVDSTYISVPHDMSGGKSGK